MPSIDTGGGRNDTLHITADDRLLNFLEGEREVDRLTQKLQLQEQQLRQTRMEANQYSSDLETANATIKELESTISDFKAGTAFAEQEEQLRQFERTAEAAGAYFESFLKSVRLLGPTDNVRYSEFSDWFNEIIKGAMEVNQAITEVKVSYRDMIPSGSGGAFDSDVVNSFITSLSMLEKKLDDVISRLNDMQENGVRALSGGAPGGASAGGGVVTTLEQIDNVAKSLSDDAKASYESITNIVNAFNEFSGSGAVNLMSIKELFKSISDIGGKSYSDEKVKSIIDIVGSLATLGTIGERISAANFSWLNELSIRKTSLDNLSTYLPQLANINYDNLARIKEVDFSNFQNLKIDKGSISSIADFVNAINNLREQIYAPQQTTGGGVIDPERLNDTANSAEAAANSIKKLADASDDMTVKFGANSGIKDIRDALASAGGVGGGNAAKIANEFSDLEGRISSVSVKWRDFADVGRQVSRVTVNALDEMGDEFQRIIDLRWKLDEDGNVVPNPDRIHSGAAKVSFDLDKQYNQAVAAVKEYYSLLQKTRSMDPTSERWAETAKALEEAKQRMEDLTSAESQEKMLAEQRLNLEQLMATARRNADIADNKRADVADAKAQAEQYNEAVKAVKAYYALRQKMYALGTEGQYLRENVVRENGVFVAKDANAQEYVNQLNRAMLAMQEYTGAANKANLTDEQRKDLLVVLIGLQDKLNLSRSSATQTDETRAEKERSAALKEAGELLERMIQLREEYNGNLKVTGSDAFQNNDANIAALQAMIDGVKNGTVEVDVLKGKLEELKGTTDANAGSMRNLAGTTNSLASGISRYFAMMFSGYRIVMMAVREIKKMVSTSIELDTAMTQLQIVTQQSDATMRAFGQTAAQVAHETATSISDVVDSATTYARLGYTLEESATLSKYTGMLQRVGNIDVSNAQDAVTAIIKAYNIDASQVDQVEAVMDKLVKVGNNFPISVSQIAEGMNNAGAAMAAAGNSFEESVALLTAANTVVQNASKASTGLRTISARLRNTKAELDELGEEMITTPKYEELVQHLTDYNVSLLDVEGNYRSTYDIMKDLAAVWDDITPNVQAAITTALAGTRQQAIFNSIISQFKEASGAMDAMADSAGELSKAYDIYMDSTQAHINQFKTAFQELSQDAVDSEFVKDFVDLGTHLIHILDVVSKLIGKVGGLNTALTVTLAIVATLKSKAIISFFTTIGAKITGIGALLGKFKTAFVAARASGASSLGAISAGFETVTATASAAQVAIGVFAAAIAAFAIISGAIQNANAERVRQAEAAYNSAMEGIDDSKNIYQLYETYVEAKRAIDDNVDSKEKLTKASEELATALGLEKDAAKGAGNELENLTKTELSKAVEKAQQAVVAAEKAFDEQLPFSIPIWSQNDRTRSLIEAIDLSLDPNNTLQFAKTTSERAQIYIDIYNKLLEMQHELIETGNTERDTWDRIFFGLPSNSAANSQVSNYDYDDVVAAITFLGPKVAAYTDAQNALAETQSRYNNALNGTVAAEHEVADATSEAAAAEERAARAENERNAALRSRDIHHRITEIRQLGNALNDLTNGNVDYNKRPLLRADDLGKDIPEMADHIGDLVTMYFATETIGEGEARYTVDITPITEDGIVLSDQEIADYLDKLVTDKGIDELLASDDLHLLLNVVPGELDQEAWEQWYSGISDIKDRHADLVDSLVEDYGLSLGQIRLLIMSSESYYGHFAEVATSTKKTLSDAWDTEEFEKTKEDLTKLSKTVDGISGDKVLELAADSDVLSDALQQSGMDAEFLAHVLQTEFANGNDGSGFALITKEALILNDALNSLAGEYAALDVARSKYESGKSTQEKDDDFRSMAEAYKTLNEQFEKGAVNSNAFWNAAEFIFGEAQLEAWGFSDGLDQIYEAMQNNKAVFEDADSAGMGFLTRLKEIADEDGNIIGENGGIIASIKELSDGSIDFKVEDFYLDELAEKMGISRDAINACIEALSMFGRIDMSDMDQVVSAIDEIGLSAQVNGQTVVNYAGVYDILRNNLGKTSQQAYETKQDLEAMDGVTLIDVAGSADDLTQAFIDLGIAEDSAGTISVNTDDLVSLMQQIGLTEDQAISLAEKLGNVDGLSFENAEGGAESLDGVLQKIDEADFANAAAEADGLAHELDVSKMSAQELVDKLNELTGKKYTVDVDRSLLEAAYNSALRLKGVMNTIGGVIGGAVRQERARGTQHAIEGTALVGEEAPEMLIRGDQATLVGIHGPEIVNLKAGDQVISGPDTKKILKHNRIIRGVIPALRAGTIGGWRPNGSATSQSAQSAASYSGSSRSSGGSSGSSSSSKKDESAFEKAYKEHQHLLKMEAETQRDYLNWLNDAYQKAYKNNEIELEDYWKYMEEVYSGMKDLFMDYLGDIEHEIDMIGEDKSRVNRIVELYSTAVKAVEKEIEAARKAGLKDTDDYIQQLQKKIRDYQKELTSMREEALEEYQDSEQELVDMRIDMIKQEIDDRKDGLNKQLSDLKDFYQKQKDMLRDARDEEKYLDDQAEKRKKIADIERELSALQRDNSAWAAKRRLELEQDLSDARKELREFEKDHAIEMAEEELDRISELREEEINSQIEDLENITPHELYQQALYDIRHATSDLFNESIEWNNVYGDGIEKNIVDKWERAKTSFEDYWNTVRALTNDGDSTVMRIAGGFFRDIQSAVMPSKLKFASGTSHAPAGLHILDEFGSETIFQSKNGQKYKMFSGGEKVLNAKASDFLYKFAMSGGEFFSKLINGAANGMSYLTGGGRRLAVEAVNMGDIIINGNADRSTVSEIRRAQRDALENLLHEFDRLSR